MKEKIAISVMGSKKIFDLCDILYFEALSGRVCIHYVSKGKEQELEFEGSLKEIERQLENKGFIRIHRSCIVSMDKILEIGADYLILKEAAARLPVGRVFQQRLWQYLKESNLILL